MAIAEWPNPNRSWQLLNRPNRSRRCARARTRATAAARSARAAPLGPAPACAPPSRAATVPSKRAVAPWATLIWPQPCLGHARRAVRQRQPARCCRMMQPRTVGPSLCTAWRLLGARCRLAAVRLQRRIEPAVLGLSVCKRRHRAWRPCPTPAAAECSIWGRSAPAGSGGVGEEAQIWVLLASRDLMGACSACCLVADAPLDSHGCCLSRPGFAPASAGQAGLQLRRGWFVGAFGKLMRRADGRQKKIMHGGGADCRQRDACADSGSLQGFHWAKQVLLGGCEERPGLQTWDWLRVCLSFGMLDDRGAQLQGLHAFLHPGIAIDSARQADRLGPHAARAQSRSALRLR